MSTEQLVSTLARKYRVDVFDGDDTDAVTLTDVPAAASTDNFTSNAHGLSVGTEVTVTGSDITEVPNGTYYVSAATVNTFQLSATLGGTSIDILTDGTADVASTGTGWVQVRAITGLKPTIDSNMEDDSDYDSDGWGSEVKTAMSWKLELDLGRKVGVTSRAYDPGQEIIRVAGDKFGPDSVVRVRWYDRNGGPEAYEGYASVDWAPEGGSYSDLDKAKATLSGQGARTVITNPVPTP